MEHFDPTSRPMGLDFISRQKMNFVCLYGEITWYPTISFRIERLKLLYEFTLNFIEMQCWKLKAYLLYHLSLQIATILRKMKRLGKGLGYLTHGVVKWCFCCNGKPSMAVATTFQIKCLPTGAHQINLKKNSWIVYFLPLDLKSRNKRWIDTSPIEAQLAGHGTDSQVGLILGWVDRLK